MGSSKPSMLVVLLLLFITSLEHTNKLVFADKKLIEQQCHNAEMPETCIECLKSNPKGQEADKVEIAAIVITCLSNNSQVLANNMSSLASTAQDKNLKSLFQDCEKGFIQANSNLSTAMNELMSKNYDKTNNFVRTALQPEIDCKKNVVSLTPSVPSDVLDQMRVYEELSDAAMRIIDRF
ncbi:hypothetical protein PTKIN_Ptkin14bG0228700 [Pterospermum kingtungense]